MWTFPLFVSGLLLLMATSSHAVVCFNSTYTRNSSACSQDLEDLTGVETCVGTSCITYFLPKSGQDYNTYYRGCYITPLNISFENCLQNNLGQNETFFIHENQCCYQFTWGGVTCHCIDDHCNACMRERAFTLSPTQGPSTWHPPFQTFSSQNPTNFSSSREGSFAHNIQPVFGYQRTANDPNSVTCFSCTYTNSSTSYRYSTCNETIDASYAGTCTGSACSSVSYANDDYVTISRGCSELPTNFSVDQCLQNNVGKNATFYEYENQCCYKFYDEINKSNFTSCFCVGDYCNLKVSQAALVPRNSINTCYSCSFYGSNYGASTCNETVDPTVVKKCSGSACYWYAHVIRNDETIIERGCDSLPFNFNLDRCEENKAEDNTSYYTRGNQCCYTVQDNLYAITICFCKTKYCNDDITKPVLIPESTPVTRSPSLTTSSSSESSNNIICYSCSYWSNSTASSDSACQEPFNPNGVGTCVGKGCYSYVYLQAGASYVERGCGELPPEMTLSRCLENGQTLNDATLFIHGNQCCYSMWTVAVTYCFCADDYCNNNISVPNTTFTSTTAGPNSTLRQVANFTTASRSVSFPQQSNVSTTPTPVSDWQQSNVTGTPTPVSRGQQSNVSGTPTPVSDWQQSNVSGTPTPVSSRQQSNVTGTPTTVARGQQSNVTGTPTPVSSRQQSTVSATTTPVSSRQQSNVSGTPTSVSNYQQSKTSSKTTRRTTVQAINNYPAGEPWSRKSGSISLNLQPLILLVSVVGALVLSTVVRVI